MTYWREILYGAVMLVLLVGGIWWICCETDNPIDDEDWY